MPREVCVTQRINPKKVMSTIKPGSPIISKLPILQLFRPVIKEWCYKPSQYSSIPDNRNIRQYTNKNSLFWAKNSFKNHFVTDRQTDTDCLATTRAYFDIYQLFIFTRISECFFYICPSVHIKNWCDVR